jgi:hypothetical protein
MATRSAKIGTKNIALRGKIFPELGADDLWDRKKYDGFTSIPRTMPIIMNIIDDLTKAKPAARTYLSLWCKVYDEMYVSLQNDKDLAYHSGFTGQRAVRTWRERMLSLAELELINVASGPRGDLSHAVILNPHFAIRKLHDAGTPGLSKSAFNTLLERANEIGAKDMELPLPK